MSPTMQNDRSDRTDGIASIITSSSIPFHYNTAHLHVREGSSIIDEMVVLKAANVPGEYITSMMVSEWQELLQITENKMLVTSAIESVLHNAKINKLKNKKINK